MGAFVQKKQENKSTLEIASLALLRLSAMTLDVLLKFKKISNVSFAHDYIVDHQISFWLF